MDIVGILNQIDAVVWGPLMICLLLGSHIFLLTIRTGFIQRKLPKAIKMSVVNDEGSEGDVSQFGALVTALAGTIGTGSIVGVATAVSRAALARCSGCGLRACSALPRNIPRSMPPSNIA